MEQTDYKMAKNIPALLERFEETEVVVENIESFRRYLCVIAQKEKMLFQTKKVGEGTIKIFRIR